MKAVSALDVARAALMEVGVDPARVFITPSPTSDTGFSTAARAGDWVARRASRLGNMAAYGPEHLIRCDACLPDWRAVGPCTPVRDVLRGVTCGRVA